MTTAKRPQMLMQWERRSNPPLRYDFINNSGGRGAQRVSDIALWSCSPPMYRDLETFVEDVTVLEQC